ncbi:hypothetical protein RJ45_05115 [Photobacterium gaetbulicola]|uniref:Uncharacterized protein n=1 Tax=Photobacterium gaetbulicola TaxID=1295392 RepID=A0A0B9G818_9GAMM|nr:hypothetical protein RJ45_05115 [Photobacterium gaetbulicola]
MPSCTDFVRGFMKVCIIYSLKLASEQSYEQVFEVMQTGQRRVRYDMFEYVKLSDGNTEVYLNLGQDKENPYKRGDLVSVTLKKGFWGFYFVEKASKKKLTRQLTGRLTAR